MVSATMSCVKYLLFVFNLLFAISGIIIIVVGVITQGVYYDYHHFIDDKLLTAPIILIAIGVVTFFVAFFGCCGAVRENQCMISTFAGLLLILFAVELASGVTAYIFRSDVNDMMSNQFRNSLNFYHNNTEVKDAWDILQQDFHCCGVDDTSDWKNQVPSSCCIINTPDEPCSEGDAFKVGCLTLLQSALEKNALLLGGVGIGVALVQLLGVLFGCCLARSIRKDYETV